MPFYWIRFINLKMQNDAFYLKIDSPRYASHVRMTPRKLRVFSAKYSFIFQSAPINKNIIQWGDILIYESSLTSITIK